LNVLKIVSPSYEILSPTTHEEVMEDIRRIEQVARTCYKSEGKTTLTSYRKLLERLRDSGHHAMLEHASMTVKFTCDRGVSHELVRHRLASFAQESTRYVNYEGTGLEVICPPEIFHDENDHIFSYWQMGVVNAEIAYRAMVQSGLAPQIARSVLPTCLKTEINVTANYREWRHILSLRSPVTAHPQMRDLIIPLLTEVKQLVPIVFEDLGVPSDYSERIKKYPAADWKNYIYPGEEVK
jgi:thymidylate synthase (FAD)